MKKVLTFVTAFCCLMVFTRSIDGAYGGAGYYAAIALCCLQLQVIYIGAAAERNRQEIRRLKGEAENRKPPQHGSIL